MSELEKYLAANRDREFKYGEWDCALFVLGWVEITAPRIAADIRKWLADSGYFERVNGERTFRRWLAQRQIRGPGACALNEFGPLRSVLRPREGLVVCLPQPRGVFGLVTAELRAVLLLRGRGFVVEDIPADAVVIGWEGNDGR